MAYQIYVSEDQEYVTVKHVGEVTLDELEEAREAIKNVLFEKSLHKVFVDVSEVTSVLKRIEQFCFIGRHNDIYPENIKISVVVPKNLYEYDRYIEEVAISFETNQKIFVSKEEAIKWLKQNAHTRQCTGLRSQVSGALPLVTAALPNAPVSGDLQRSWKPLRQE